MRRAVVAALALVALATTARVALASEAPASTCETRTLVLSAYPAETDAVMAHAVVDPTRIVVSNGRHFYFGTIAGKPVIMAMTGIGLVNARTTTETAFAAFTCASGVEIGAVVFSGVAGGSERSWLGDVTAPARWTLDGGATWRSVDPDMLAVAQQLAVPGAVHFDRVNNAGISDGPGDPLNLPGFPVQFFVYQQLAADNAAIATAAFLEAWPGP